MSTLSPDAKRFADHPADAVGQLAAVRPLVAALSAADAQALVTHLSANRQRLHLEALGELTSHKEAKKAARQAAYKLKSAGVGAGALTRAAAVDLTVTAELDKACMVVAPGLDGHTWIVLASLPGAGGGEIDIRSREKGPRLDVIDELALGRLKKVWTEVSADARLQKPLLVHASVGARLVRRFAASLEAQGAALPPKLPHFLAWADRAVALGAKPDEAAARGRVTPAAGPIGREQLEALAANPLVGYLAPAETALDAIEVAFKPLMHSDAEIDEADFRKRLAGLVDDAADRWMADPTARALAVGWMEDTADVLLAAGDEGAAAVALAIADELALYKGEGHAMGLAQFVFAQAVDGDSAWHHRQAHIRGEAHHGHEHAHG